MWDNINSIGCLSDARQYGEDLYKLSQISHNSIYCGVIDTIALSPNIFQNYLNKRYIDSNIVDECIKNLKKLDYSNKIIIKISTYKDCNMNTSPLVIQTTHSNITNALSNCFERWFDGKPYAYRRAHKMANEETYPIIYIQPFVNDNIYTMITRNSINGKLITQTDYNTNIHCTIKHFDKLEQLIITEIDRIIAVPQKVHFFYGRSNDKAKIVHIENYPMKRNAYLSCLVEKHKNHAISDEVLIEKINPSDIISFDGYKLTANNIYRGLGNGLGVVMGKIAFRSSNWDDIAYHHSNQSYVFAANDYDHEDRTYLRYCKAAIFKLGGITSHGMVAMRGLGKTAIVDNDIYIDEINKQLNINNETIEDGDTVCLFGVTGEWAKNGSSIPSYRANIGNNPINYIIEALESIKNKNLANYPLEFQMHFGNVTRSIKTLGYKI